MKLSAPSMWRSGLQRQYVRFKYDSQTEIVNSPVQEAAGDSIDEIKMSSHHNSKRLNLKQDQSQHTHFEEPP